VDQFYELICNGGHAPVAQDPDKVGEGHAVGSEFSQMPNIEKLSGVDEWLKF